MNLYENAYNILDKQYKSIIKRKKKVLLDKDVEDLHQMRVAVRRLAAALKVFRECVDVDLRTVVAKDIKLLAKNLGKVRDLDVSISYIQNYNDKYSEHSAVLFVIEQYQNKRKKDYKLLHRYLETKKFTKLIKNILKLIEDLEYKKQNVDCNTFIQPFYKNIDSLIDEVYSFKKLKDLKKSEEDLHSLRIAIKHLRYALEFLDLETDESKNAIKIFKTLQEKLGVINDLRVLNDQLEKILKKEKLDGETLTGIRAFKAYNKLIKTKETKNIQFPWEFLSSSEIKKIYTSHLS